MRFTRLMVVVVSVTVCGGIFGAAVGGLVGSAVPSSLKVMFGVGKTRVQTDAPASPVPTATPDAAGSTVTDTQGHAGVGIERQSGMAATGAALGGAWGLILGMMVALLLAALDQIILVVRAAMPRKPVTVTA
jgi:hypothetical protein